MGIWFADGYDEYNSLPMKWTGSTNSVAFVTSGTLPARTGAQCLTVPTANMFANCPTAHKSATFGICVAVYKTGTNADARFAFMSDGATISHVNFRTLADGSLAVYQAAATTVLLAQSAPGLLPTNAWFQLEMKVTMGDGTAGSVEARLNGSTTPILSNMACDTKNAGSAQFDSIGILRNSGLSMWYLDDTVCWSTALTPNNDWLGDVVVDTLFPTGAGATTGMTPSAGANYAAVDDAIANTGTTDYVQSDVVDVFDTYQMADMGIAASASVKAVIAQWYAQKSDAGARSAAPVLRTNSTNYTGADQSLATGFAPYKQTYEVSPDTSAAWTGANVNALEVGVKVRP